jgi:tRNA-splicing ligase RtcB
MNILHSWLAQPLPADVQTALTRLARSPDIQQIAIMPDVHLAHDVCIGTVLATRHLLYPGAVGGDIGCGMSALAFDAGADLLAEESQAAQLLRALYETVPANRHRAPRDLPAALAHRNLSHPSLESIKRRDARVQLGTLGRGNHFLEFQSDEENRLWLMLHTGSRAVGQAIRDFYLQQAQITQQRPGDLPSIDSRTPAGEAYLHDMTWALDYAKANRDAILAAVTDVMQKLFKIKPITHSTFDCHHNFVRLEKHFDQSLLIHRKGALSAAAGEPGIIPGSMASQSFHTEGRGLPAALNSSSHGAGRAMSRDQARRTISAFDLQQQMRAVWFDHSQANRLRDEAPSAYKNIHKVMRAQNELTKITRILRPLLSYKGP